MEANVEEALRAKAIAEKRFAEKDFAGAKTYALKAKNLCPGLEGISQMVATFEVYIASEVKCNGEIDYYSVLGLKPSADRDAVKKQYRKMAVLLHPDKNKTVGADGAFKLVSEAWTMLSDNLKRSSYDLKRTSRWHLVLCRQTYLLFMLLGSQDITIVPILQVLMDLTPFGLYALLVKFNMSIYGTPVSGSFPYCPWSYVPGSGYGSHGYDGVTYVPTTAAVFTGNGASGLHTGHGYEYVSNVSFQWSSFSGTSSGVVGHNGSSAVSTDAVYQVNGNAAGARANLKTSPNGKRSIKAAISNMNSSVSASYNESSGSKAVRPDKKRKVVFEANFRNGYEEKGLNSAPEVGLANGNASAEHNPKLSNPNELPARRISIAPAFDARKLLIDKARTDIRKKLEEIKSAAIASAAVKQKAQDQSREAGVGPKCDHSDVSGRQIKPSKAGPISITVPDPDFHDFDKDRSEECFKPKQIWAIYDEDDGMPRLYCLIRQIISVEPFKILITYLNSKTDSEFGPVNWIDSGFTKSCGHFRAWNTDIVDQVNIFSHVLKGEKAGRGGCVRVYPKRGDIWAVYQNWSPDWNISTPDDVRHQYEMVEVLDGYSEELGVCVAPLVKLAGFKTVYQRNTNKDAIRWIPRRGCYAFLTRYHLGHLKEKRGICQISVGI
ncbi:hypothetical protein GH714_021979 [Hevea brasiliensis]|uniref:J domain-containing protein n=1 Tax=Hevea brasiliensis TaxID=3981 RepID=A0A6A6KV05_HEVBR|nr:hypothetical protein GH714_021979 [Hevea brasiliensis]